LAKGTNALIGKALIPEKEKTLTPFPKPYLYPPSYHRVFKKERTEKFILKRNIFDSEVGPLDPESIAKSLKSLAQEQENSQMTVEKCTDNKTLLAVLVSPQNTWSLAMIKESQNISLYKEQDQIGDSEISGITWRYVFIRSPLGRECYLDLWEPERGNKPFSSRISPRPRPSLSSRDSLIKQLERGIEKVSETEYNIDRGVVDKTLENQAILMRSARIIPHEEKGRVVGFKLFGIRPYSLFGKIGLRNGDVIHRINGYEITSPDKALEAYSKLRNADRLTVSITRRGRKMNLDYNIR
jgi:general secretion pathway protein C